MNRRGLFGMLAAVAAAPVALPLAKFAPTRWRLIGSRNGVTSEILRPRVAKTFTRMGSYVLGGQQSYSPDVIGEMAKRHVQIVAHWPGWKAAE